MWGFILLNFVECRQPEVRLGGDQQGLQMELWLERDKRLLTGRASLDVSLLIAG